VRPEELEASKALGGVFASISANSFILKASRSGPFSCTKSASLTARLSSGVNFRRSIDAPGDRPSAVSAGQAASTYLKSACSAPGAGSVATTSSPWARKHAAQLPPITPVPTIATRLTSESFSMILVSQKPPSERARKRRRSLASPLPSRLRTASNVPRRSGGVSQVTRIGVD